MSQLKYEMLSLICVYLTTKKCKKHGFKNSLVLILVFRYSSSTSSMCLRLFSFFFPPSVLRANIFFLTGLFRRRKWIYVGTMHPALLPRICSTVRSQVVRRYEFGKRKPSTRKKDRRRQIPFSPNVSWQNFKYDRGQCQFVVS